MGEKKLGNVHWSKSSGPNLLLLPTYLFFHILATYVETVSSEISVGLHLMIRFSRDMTLNYQIIGPKHFKVT